MAVSAIQCGSCQRSFRRPDGVQPGQRLRCPSCGGAIIIPPEEAPLDLGTFSAPTIGTTNNEFGNDESRSAARGADSVLDADAAQSLRRGLILHAVANGLYVFGLLFFLIVYFVATSDSASSSSSKSKKYMDDFVDIKKEEAQTGLKILVLIQTACLFGNWVLAALGQGSLMSAPWRFGARGKAIAMLVFSTILVLQSSLLLRFLDPLALGWGRDVESFAKDLVSPRGRDFSIFILPLFVALFFLEGARLSVLGSFVHSTGKMLSRRSPPTGGAGILAIVVPCLFAVLYLIGYFLIQSEDLTKGKITTIIVLDVLGIVAMLSWGIACLLVLSSALGRVVSRRS